MNIYIYNTSVRNCGGRVFRERKDIARATTYLDDENASFLKKEEKTANRGKRK